MADTLRDILAHSEDGLAENVAPVNLPAAPLPVTPANGAVTSSHAGQFGALRTVFMALTGDGTATQFTLIHGLGYRPQEVRGYASAGGALGARRTLAASPHPTDPLNMLLVTFVPGGAPAAGVTIFVAAIA
jgi:hypothetical protein